MVETEINHLVAGEGSWGKCVSKICNCRHCVPFETKKKKKELGFYINAVSVATTCKYFFALLLIHFSSFAGAFIGR